VLRCVADVLVPLDCEVGAVNSWQIAVLQVHA